jgi:ATP-dependent exoDNAse (exonuclease V) beta subunit
MILNDIDKLKAHGLLEEIVLPRKNSYAELPFILKKRQVTSPGDEDLPPGIYSGRIDRIIISDGKVLIYDYKTFPLREGELDGLTGKYKFQMQTYKEAAERIFKSKARAYLLFTHMPRIVEA